MFVEVDHRFRIFHWTRWTAYQQKFFAEEQRDPEVGLYTWNILAMAKLFFELCLAERATWLAFEQIGTIENCAVAPVEGLLYRVVIMVEQGNSNIMRTLTWILSSCPV